LKPLQWFTQLLTVLFFLPIRNAITAAVNAKITERGIETPLGVLTKAQIEKGEAILLSIGAKLQVNISTFLFCLKNPFFE
jgi:hypothetical protein